MLPDELKKSVELTLGIQFEKSVEISEIISVGGGCINEAYSLKTNIGKYFIKYNSASVYPEMFEKEAAGLKILADTNTIEIPVVIGSAEAGEYSYLLLQYIGSANKAKQFWNDF